MISKTTHFLRKWSE